MLGVSLMGKAPQFQMAFLLFGAGKSVLQSLVRGLLPPASCSLSTAMICSSVNLCFFIRPSFKPENSSLRWSRNLGRFKSHRGSNRRWMKVQWQVTVGEGGCCALDKLSTNVAGTYLPLLHAPLRLKPGPKTT